MTISGLQGALGGATHDKEGSEYNITKAAPALIAYFFALLLGIVTGFLWKSGTLRCVLVSVSTLATILCLVVQLYFVWGLREAASPPSIGPPPPGKSDMEIRYTQWLLLVYGLHVLAIITSTGDWWLIRKPPETIVAQDG
jgi:hypothetical protein